jgi:hypothetical protein
VRGCFVAGVVSRVCVSARAHVDQLVTECVGSAEARAEAITTAALGGVRGATGS